MELERLDLNLLTALRALLAEKNITHAATRLGVSPPAVSVALAKLRLHFDDQLLVREGTVWKLTPLASSLEERVLLALLGVEEAFRPEAGFDAESTDRTFTVEFCDWSDAVLLDAIVERLGHAAPGAALTVSRLHDTASSGAPAPDLRLGPSGSLSVFGDDASTLFVDRLVCVTSFSESLGSGTPLDDWRRVNWGTISRGGHSTEAAIAHLEALGLEPRVDFHADGLETLARSATPEGRAAYLPLAFARVIASACRLQIVEPVESVGEVVQQMSWDHRRRGDPSLSWLRGVVEAAATERLSVHPQRR